MAKKKREKPGGGENVTCTCYFGHSDHSVTCYCTTSIADCAVHATSEMGRAISELCDEQERRLKGTRKLDH